MLIEIIVKKIADEQQEKSKIEIKEILYTSCELAFLNDQKYYD